MEKIYYVLTGDKNYLDQLLVVMTSILKNHNSAYTPHFILLMKEISLKEKQYLESILKVGACEVEIIDASVYESLFEMVDVSKFKNTYINIVCYYRLLMFKILPDDVEKCFYIDGDMIVVDDLSWIWNEMDSSLLLSAVVEIHAMEHRESILSHLKEWDEFSKFNKDPVAHPYFNAGFFLLNVSLAKKLCLWDKAQEFLKNHPNPPFADQDILNAIIGQAYSTSIKFLPPYYNVFCDAGIDYDKKYERSYYSPDLIADSFKFGKILHYAGGLKPWNYNNCHYYNEWWMYAAESPAAGSLLLKGQDIHSELCKELYYVKSENQKLMHDVPECGNILSRYCNKIDPIILTRYKRYHTQNNSLIKRLSLLYRCIHDAKKQTNSDHNVDIYGIKHKIDMASYVSFDLFDTLVCRPFAHPTDVFNYLEKKLGREGFAKKRIDAENNARQKYCNMEEVTIDQIYEFLNTASDLKEIEMETEVSIQFRNPVVSELYDYALGNNKIIFITSDMYLPKNIIEKILSRCGYNNYSKIFLSSECGHTKIKGTLFDDLLNCISDRNPRSVLHIGDNLISDYEIPMKKGIEAVRITKNIDALLESNCRASEYYRRNSSLESSLFLSVLSTFRCEKYDYWTQFGIFYAGIVVYAYMQWLYKELKKTNTNVVFFVARDGFTLEKAFNIISKDTFETHYIYAPRRISNLCNMDLKNKINTDMLEAESAVESLINYYSEYNGADVKMNSLEEKIQFIEKHMNEMKILADQKRNQYSDYLRKISSSKEIALVDLVTIHFSSQKLLSESLSDSKITGYYWAIVEKDTNADKMQKYVHSTFQKLNDFAIKDWDVMEFFITSPEAPIADISKDGKPIYRKCTKYDEIRSDVYPKISEGELMFVKRFIEVSNVDIEISAESVNCYLDTLLDMPTALDRKKVSKIKHPYDSENSKFVPIFKTWYEVK